MSGLVPYARVMEQMLKALDIATVWTLFTESMDHYGFDRIIYARTQFRTAGDFGDPDDSFLLIKHDAEYIEQFFGKALYLDAPMMVWSAKNTGICSWQWAFDRRAADTTTPKENRVLEFNQSMGVVAGYAISFPGVSGRSVAGVGLCAKRNRTQAEVDAAWADHGEEVDLIANAMHHKISTLPHERRGKTLTARQKEVLQWVADGKTTQDIAQIMGLTAGTVEKHLRLARESLNAATTAQAILKASMQNQFFLIDDFSRP